MIVVVWFVVGRGSGTDGISGRRSATSETPTASVLSPAVGGPAAAASNDYANTATSATKTTTTITIKF